MPIARRTTFKIRRTVHVYTHWLCKCGWCGATAPIATDGQNLYCHRCGY